MICRENGYTDCVVKNCKLQFSLGLCTALQIMAYISRVRKRSGLRCIKPSRSGFAWLDALQFGKAEL
ncbi:MAG: hypothetical protein K1W16_09160 [Lachnospiraceae bacterium]